MIKGNKITLLLFFVILAISYPLQTFTVNLLLELPFFLSDSSVDVDFERISWCYKALIFIFAVFFHWFMSALISIPWLSGYLMGGIKISRKEHVEFRDMIFVYRKLGSLVCANLYYMGVYFIAFILYMLASVIALSLDNTLLISLFLVVSISVCIYISIPFSLVFPLIIDKNLSAKQAIHLSKEIVQNQRFKIFLMYLVLMLIICASTLTVFLLIWTIPLVGISYGMMYNHLINSKL